MSRKAPPGIIVIPDPRFAGGATIEAGADGVAVIPAVSGAADPAAATRELLARVLAARERRGEARVGRENGGKGSWRWQ